MFFAFGKSTKPASRSSNSEKKLISFFYSQIMPTTLEQFETKRLILRKQTPEVLRNLFKTESDSDLIRLLHLDSIEELRKEQEKKNKGP